MLFDFQVISPHVNLDDLHWVSPDFPAMTGQRRARRASRRPAPGPPTTSATCTSGTATQRVDGDARRDHRPAARPRLPRHERDAPGPRPRRGAGLRRLAAVLRHAERHASPAPGSSTRWTSTIDWAFADARVPGQPVSHDRGRRASSGSTRDSGLTFTNFVVRRSDVDLRTVRRLAPAVILEGRLAAAGTLDGPLTNVTFRGTARQQDGDRPPSTATGTVLSRHPVRLARARDRRRLRSALVRRDPARLPHAQDHRASCAGRFRSEGTLSRLAVDADLTGDLGDVQRRGIHHAAAAPLGRRRTPRSGFARLDLATLTGRTLADLARPASSAPPAASTPLRAPEGEPRAGAHPEPHPRVDHRQPLRPGRRARQRDPGGHRLRRMEGRPRLGRRHARLGARRTTGGCASTSRPTA